MRLLIIRHADPLYENDTLTEQGHLQAQALAERLASGIVQRVPTHLYSSPMGRARDTAQYTEKLLGKKAEIEDWTRELSSWGRLSANDVKQGGRPGEGGIALWDTSAEYLRNFEPSLTRETEWTEFSNLQVVHDQYKELCAKSDAFLARHGYVREGGTYRVVRKSEDQIAVFCHAGFGLTWLSHLLHLPLSTVWCSFHLPVSSITTVLMDQRSSDFASPRVIGLGDVSHLYKAGVEITPSKYEKPNAFYAGPRPSGIKANFW